MLVVLVSYALDGQIGMGNCTLEMGELSVPYYYYGSCRLQLKIRQKGKEGRRDSFFFRRTTSAYSHEASSWLKRRRRGRSRLSNGGVSLSSCPPRIGMTMASHLILAI